MPKITFRHGQEFMISTGADFNRVYRVKKSVGNEGFDFFTDSDKYIGRVTEILDDQIRITMMFMGQFVTFPIPNNEINFC